MLLSPAHIGAQGCTRQTKMVTSKTIARMGNIISNTSVPRLYKACPALSRTDNSIDVHTAHFVVVHKGFRNSPGPHDDGSKEAPKPLFF